ncbi:MAG: hypothetical protein SOW80_12245 [Anaerovoracaceae bacterium]|nr:hypothetical protein [Anaerovoracaceae bacterium]
MKNYVTPKSYTMDIVAGSGPSFKQVANSFSRGFAKGVSAGIRGNVERPISLKPIEIIERGK